MPLVRKRRAEAQPSVAASSDSDDATPTARTRSVTLDHDHDRDRSAAAYDDGVNGIAPPDGSSTAQMVKKMVRLALACEYSRIPIRRAEISAKVLGQYGRQFRPVFEAAQRELRGTFGMEMVELPLKEKVTVTQRRAAQRTEKTSTSSHQYCLKSVLPTAYRVDAEAIVPPQVPTMQHEATFVGLYTFIISIISLCGGSINEQKLERYLKRADADQYTPVDKTEKLLQRLCKEGYLLRVKETAGGDDVVEYMVGPRGKVEVDSKAITGVVQSVYGPEAADDLEARIERSLDIGGQRGKETRSEGASKTRANASGPPDRRRSRRRAPTRGAASEDDSEDE
ncbi:MAG: hypothetical protein M1833_005903 [Piccolia ochrophora]|nr:MAG: hypothetical protein M1833_005903 [Piccolia ochrophora]